MNQRIAMEDISVGDIIVIKDLKNFVGSKSKILEENIPYTVTSKYNNFFYIENMGKNVTVHNSDLSSIEVIYTQKTKEEIVINKRELKLGDNAVIINIKRIEGAEELGFLNSVLYEVIRKENDFIVLGGDKANLLVNENEYDFIVHEYDYINEEVHDVIAYFEREMREREIDRLLSTGNFKALEQLMNE